MRVLIVDDDKAMVKLLSALVEYCGHDSVSTLHGSQAAELYESETPDVVFMDIIMPVVDGISAAGTILESDPEAQIVFISAIGDYPSEISHALRCRVTLLHKPVTLRQIREVLETFIPRHADSRES
jgi:two-component system chemotaxis response regulator CheY